MKVEISLCKKRIKEASDFASEETYKMLFTLRLLNTNNCFL